MASTTETIGMEWLTTPGHGYLKVPVSTWPNATLYCTQFSYTDRRFVYLEEDCDATAFIIGTGLDGEVFRALPDRHIDTIEGFGRVLGESPLSTFQLCKDLYRRSAVRS